MVAATEAIDAMNKVSKILEFLASECKNDGLCHILDACVSDLDTAAINLEICDDPDMPQA